MPDAQALVAGVIVALVTAAALTIVFGLTGRTIMVAVAVAIGVGAFYPGGTTGLVVDALRPLGRFVQREKDRNAARDAAVGGAADGQATAPTR